MMISNWKNSLVSMVYKEVFLRFKGYVTSISGNHWGSLTKCIISLFAAMKLCINCVWDELNKELYGARCRAGVVLILWTNNNWMTRTNNQRRVISSGNLVALKHFLNIKYLFAPGWQVALWTITPGFVVYMLWKVNIFLSNVINIPRYLEYFVPYKKSPSTTKRKIQTNAPKSL